MKKPILFIFVLTYSMVLMAQDQTIKGKLTINPTGFQYDQGIRISETNDKWSTILLGAVGETGTSENAWLLGRSKSFDFVISRNSSTGANGLVLSKSGNMGLGVLSPQHRLEVNGTIRSKEVKIEAIGWSDFVFAEGYKLPSLAEVENHIKVHKHLPDIPSEKEVQEVGISVGEMQAKLLQKIEELTLYVIELKKENESIKHELNELKNE